MRLAVRHGEFLLGRVIVDFGLALPEVPRELAKDALAVREFLGPARDLLIIDDRFAGHRIMTALTVVVDHEETLLVEPADVGCSHDRVEAIPRPILRRVDVFEIRFDSHFCGTSLSVCVDAQGSPPGLVRVSDLGTSGRPAAVLF